MIIIYSGCYLFYRFTLRRITLPKSSAVKISPSADKLSVPGVNITEILEFEDVFPEIRENIATVMLSATTVAQIRVALQSSKPTIVQSLPSVNLINRTVLSKSAPLLYVSGAVAIRRTVAAYATDSTPERISDDHRDLCENTSGPIITRGGLASHLDDPNRLRAYRRGIMAQTTGLLQSTPIHYPRKIARDVEKVSPNDFLSRLPFNTSDLKYENVLAKVNSLISPTGIVISCTEQPTVLDGSVLLESGLLISRTAPALPNITAAPADLTKLPAWRRAAIKQVKSLGGDS